jgi:hypothetical protein
MAVKPIIQNSTLTDENGVTAVTVATGGAVTLNKDLTLNYTSSSEGGQLNLKDSDGINDWSIDSQGTAGAQNFRIISSIGPIVPFEITRAGAVTLTGSTTGAKPASGKVGEPFGTEYTGTNGSGYSTKSTSAPSSGSTSHTWVSVTLNKGVYLISASFSANFSSGTSGVFVHSFTIGGSGTSIIEPRQSTFNGAYGGYASQMVPIRITADSTTVVFVSNTAGGSFGTVNDANSAITAVRIA